MELDLAGMHQLAAGQGIDPETLDAALSEALRLAYLKTPHAAKHARVGLIRVPEALLFGLRMRFRSNRPRIILTLRRLWARNMTLRVTLAAWPQPPRQVIGQLFRRHSAIRRGAAQRRTLRADRQ